MIRCHKHVFAHRGHYRTLVASEGLHPSEVEQLEQYHFGQTNDPNYLDSLGQEPGLILRRLNSGRVALTKVVKGPQDAAGRSTLAFVSLVFSEAAWLSSIASNLVEVVQARGTVWDGRTAVVELPEPKPLPLGEGYNVRIADSLGTQFQKALCDGTSLLSYSDFVNLPVVAHLIATSAPEDLQMFSFAYRSLSDAVPVSINILDRRYTPSGTGGAIKWFQNGQQPRASGNSEKLMPMGTRTSKRARQSAVPTATRKESQTMNTSKRRGQALMVLTAVLSALSLAAVIGIWLQVRQLNEALPVITNPAGEQNKITEIRDFVSDIGRNDQDTQNRLTNLEQKHTALQDQISEFRKFVEGAFDNASKRVNERLDTLDKNSLAMSQHLETILTRVPSTQQAPDASNREAQK